MIKFNIFMLFLFSKGYLIKKILKKFFCSDQVLKTLVEVCKRLEIAWQHSHFVLGHRPGTKIQKLYNSNFINGSCFHNFIT